MWIKRVLISLVIVLLLIIVLAYSHDKKIQRDSEKQKLVIQTLVSSLFAGNKDENLQIDDPRNIVAQCGKSAVVQSFYASSVKHRFDYRIFCPNNFEAYVQVQAHDDGRHSVFVRRPPVNVGR